MKAEAVLETDSSPASLDHWLAFIQQQHWRTIDLKLDRVGAVWQRLGQRPAPLVIAVAGTNGKGSCVAMLDAVLRAAGLRTGSYTSPHLVRYNERIAIDGEPVSDQLLVETFQEIERVREGVPLTYFEFGTICALRIFAKTGVDACILETGMGGRLDAVNIVDNDVTLITSIGLDHEQWLGHDRETIGREKAGLINTGGMVVCADPSPPASIREVAAEKGASMIQAGEDYTLEYDDDGTLVFQSGHAAMAQQWRQIPGIRQPFPGEHQRQNLGCVVAALGILASSRGLTTDSLDGLQAASIAGRCQIVDGEPLTILDVAHNADSARYLAEMLAQSPVAGVRHAVFGALADKELSSIVNAIESETDCWFLSGIDDERGQSAEELEGKLLALLPDARTRCFPDAISAFRAARASADKADRIVVFGSFHIVGDILAAVKEEFIDGS